MKHGEGEDGIDRDPIIQATPPISDSAFSRLPCMRQSSLTTSTVCRSGNFLTSA